MDWLLTVKKQVPPDEIDALLASWGCERDAEIPPVPLGDDEQVIAVTGPRDLPQMAAHEVRVRKVSPNSPLTLY